MSHAEDRFDSEKKIRTKVKIYLSRMEFYCNLFDVFGVLFICNRFEGDEAIEFSVENQVFIQSIFSRVSCWAKLVALDVVEPHK